MKNPNTALVTAAITLSIAVTGAGSGARAAVAGSNALPTLDQIVAAQTACDPARWNKLGLSPASAAGGLLARDGVTLVSDLKVAELPTHSTGSKRYKLNYKFWGSSRCWKKGANARIIVKSPEQLEMEFEITRDTKTGKPLIKDLVDYGESPQLGMSIYRFQADGPYADGFICLTEASRFADQPSTVPAERLCAGRPEADRAYTQQLMIKKSGELKELLRKAGK